MSNDLTLGEEAITYLFPLYEMARMRAATSPRRIVNGLAGDSPESPLRWCNVFIHARQLLSSGKSRVVTPNNDTLYTNAWLDLSQGPLVIEVPDTAGRYYVLGLLDMYTNPFASLGTRTTGTQARSFLVTPPGWQGELPKAFQAPGAHIASPTNAVWIIGRILIDGEHELDTVHAVQDGFAMHGLDGSSARRFDPGFALASLGAGQPSAQQFAQVVNHTLAENPPPASEQALVARFADLGFGARLGPPSPSQLQAIEQALTQCLAHWRQSGVGRESATGWQSMPMLGRSFGTDYTRRAIVALKYIGALESLDAYYPMAFSDGQGRRLNGAHHYQMHFAAEAFPPVDSFWSITLYNSADFMLVPNPIHRFAIGDRTSGLSLGPDGSLTLHISHQQPTDPRQLANWLPAPEGDFYLCLRAYMPQASILEGRYVLPPVVRLD